MRAALVALLLTGCASTRARVIAPLGHSERLCLTLRVRDQSGRLLATIEQSAPMGGTYVFYMVDPFLQAISAAFEGSR